MYIVGSVQKFSCLKSILQITNKQTSEKKIFNKLKTGEEEKFLSRYKTVNHPGHLVLL